MEKKSTSTSLEPEIESGIPFFAIKVYFDQGRLRHCEYRTLGLGDLWSLVGVAASVDQEVLFEISREDVGFSMLGYKGMDGFCLFHDDTAVEATIVFPNRPIAFSKKGDVVKVVDGRWALVYFLPKSTFASFDETVEIGNRALAAGKFENPTKLQMTVSILSSLGFSPEDYDYPEGEE